MKDKSNHYIFNKIYCFNVLAPIKAIFNILLVVAKNFLICEALIINKVKTPQENIGCIEPCACDIWGVTDTLPKPSEENTCKFLK